MMQNHCGTWIICEAHINQIHISKTTSKAFYNDARVSFCKASKKKKSNRCCELSSVFNLYMWCISAVSRYHRYAASDSGNNKNYLNCFIMDKLHFCAGVGGISQMVCFLCTYADIALVTIITFALSLHKKGKQDFSSWK